MSLLAKFVAKRRKVYEARAVCQLRFLRRVTCALCDQPVINRRLGRPEDALCHPLGCSEHPCHAACMLAQLGLDRPATSQQECPSPGCGRAFTELCFHRALLGRCSGQRSLSEGLSFDSVPGEEDSHEHDGAESTAGSDADFDADFEPLELSLDCIELECVICCDPIVAPVGVPDACCHSFCLGCLQRWCGTSATCPMDRHPIQFIYRRPAPGAKFDGRYRLDGDGNGDFESMTPAVPPHFSEAAAASDAAATEPQPRQQTQAGGFFRRLRFWPSAAQE